MIETLSDALAAQGYDSLTPVQEAVTDPDLLSSDLLVSAQTGSGKTVGFGLAIAPTLLGDATHFSAAGTPLGLVIAPTRELALQVTRELSWLYAKAGAVIASCVGGMDTRTERRTLERGVHVVVATPGRLCDHIKRGNIDLSQIRAVVLDEADEMLDMGFREELEFILDEAPEDRRTLLFSATVPKAIAKLAERYQRDAQRITTVGEARQHADIEYRALNTHPRDIENAIINVLRFYEAKNAIVFCNTRAAVARMTSRLTNRGFSVVALSGELTQSERTNALQALRDGRARVCVATDVAARGIDLPNLELVIHADLPSNSDTLLHRSGRTGRAGRKGVSALIVPPKLRTKANRLLGWAKLQADWGDPPSAADVNAKDEERLLADPSWSDPVAEDAAPFVAQLTEQFTPEQLASAFVNLYRARQSAPEELADASAPDDRPKPTFGPSVWFEVSIGRDAGAEPRMLLPMLCRYADLTKNDIGAIRVQPRNSYVEVLATRAGAVASVEGQDVTVEQDITVKRLAKAPDLGPSERPKRAPRDAKPGHRGQRPGKPTRKPYAKKTEEVDPAVQRPLRAKHSRKSDAPAGETRAKKPRASDQRDAAPRPTDKKPAAPKAAKAERAKPVWTRDKRDAAKSDAPKKKETPATGAKPKRDGSASRKRAADTSKRFVPPHKRGKPAQKGPNAKPKRRS